MKNCTHCKHADWQRNAAGRLHPSGDGRCTYEVKIPPLPSAFGWVGGMPQFSGGRINRREPLKTDCPYFAWYKDRK